MSWAEYLSIMIPLATFAAFIYREFTHWRREIREEVRGDTARISSDLAEFRSETKATFAAFRQDIATEHARMHAATQAQLQRIDNLYDVILELLKKPKKI